MRKFLSVLLAFLLSISLVMPAYAAGSSLPPDKLVEQVSNEVLDAIKKDPALAKAEPQHVNKLVDEHILPYTDFATMTRMAVGPAWRKATQAQRVEIQTLFRDLLVAVYSGALKEASNYTVVLRNNRFSDKDKLVIIRTQLQSKMNDPITLDYRLMNKDNQWKIFDVNVGGVWLVENYRSQFASVISNSGIDGLIAQLKERVAKQKGSN